MKKTLSLLLALVMLLGLAACGGSEESAAPESGAPEAPESEAPESSGTVMETDGFKINGVYVDDAYRDEDESPLRMVYLFYTLTAADTNLSADSKYTEMTINGTNTYESDHYPPACSFASNYYYSSYIEDVYMGTSLNVVATFQVPEADLAAGRTVTLADSSIPGIEAISFSTDDMIHLEGDEAICEAADPEGYAAAMEMREPADEETTAMVQNQLNGAGWILSLNGLTYDIDFWAPNNFSVTTSLGVTNSGTYTVQKGYVFCTYDSNGYTVEIPYTLTDTEFDIDMIAGFDVKG
jgi:hypothetical protein